MTYRTLLNRLLEFNAAHPDRMSDSVTIYDPEVDEFFSTDSLEVSSEVDNDVLDDGHLYIKMLK